MSSCWPKELLPIGEQSKWAELRKWSDLHSNEQVVIVTGQMEICKLIMLTLLCWAPDGCGCLLRITKKIKENTFNNLELKVIYQGCTYFSETAWSRNMAHKWTVIMTSMKSKETAHNKICSEKKNKILQTERNYRSARWTSVKVQTQMLGAFKGYSICLYFNLAQMPQYLIRNYSRVAFSFLGVGTDWFCVDFFLKFGTQCNSAWQRLFT